MQVLSVYSIEVNIPHCAQFLSLTWQIFLAIRWRMVTWKIREKVLSPVHRDVKFKLQAELR